MTIAADHQSGRGPRRQRADGERTRGAILRAAASLATVDGLEGLSIGNLAAAIGMSKSGLYAHFGSKQELQLATVEEAGRIFADEVVQPAPPVGLLIAATLNSVSMWKPTVLSWWFTTIAPYLSERCIPPLPVVGRGYYPRARDRC